MTKKAKFIVFEGIDGSGKTTISSLLYNKLNADIGKTYKTAEPTNSPIGSVIRNVLNRRIVADEKTIGALFLADRLDHLQNDSNGILKYLSEGYNVISDRYYYSSYAYHVPHLSLDWVIDANKVCADLLRPDIVFFLDIPVEESMRRINTNRQFKDIFETEQRISLVRKNYHEAIKREGHKDNVVIIDAARSVDEIFEEVYEKTCEVLGMKYEV